MKSSPAASWPSADITATPRYSVGTVLREIGGAAKWARVVEPCDPNRACISMRTTTTSLSPQEGRVLPDSAFVSPAVPVRVTYPQRPAVVDSPPASAGTKRGRVDCPGPKRQPIGG